MQSLIIVKPLPVSGVLIGLPNIQRVLTPDPKEAALISDPVTLRLDMGRAVTADTAYVGYHSAGSTQIFTVQALGEDMISIGYLAGSHPLQPLGIGQPAQTIARSAPLTARYWQLDFSPENGGAFHVGVFAIGLAWQATWGTEWGAGRLIEDTGTAERLFGGGFAIDDGVAAGGYSWTFGDLQPEEVRTLYQLVKDRRTTRSVLVVEDPEQTDGLNERIHWGLFSKIDAYERLDPMNTKWALQIRDWA